MKRELLRYEIEYTNHFLVKETCLVVASSVEQAKKTLHASLLAWNIPATNYTPTGRTVPLFHH